MMECCAGPHTKEVGEVDIETFMKSNIGKFYHEISGRLREKDVDMEALAKDRCKQKDGKLNWDKNCFVHKGSPYPHANNEKACQPHVKDMTCQTENKAIPRCRIRTCGFSHDKLMEKEPSI